MEWRDAIAPPRPAVLRQFAVLSLAVFGGLAAWRALVGQVDGWTALWAVLGGGIGGLGLWRPEAIRLVYQAWMVAAFPIGWTVSRLILAAVYFLVFTPLAVAMRLAGRDVLGLRRRNSRSYWSAPGRARTARDYLRQS